MIQRPLMKVICDNEIEQVFVVTSIIWSHQYPGHINMIEATEIYNREETSSFYGGSPYGKAGRLAGSQGCQKQAEN